MIYTAIWFADKSRLQKLGGRGIAAYTAMHLLAVYLGIDYVFDLNWPFLEDAASLILGKPSEFIVKLLTVPS